MKGILNGTSSFNISHAALKVVSQVNSTHDISGLLTLSVWYLKQN